jgi:hypothetical protein
LNIYRPEPESVDLLGLVLYGAPLPIMVASIAWLVKLNTSQQKGERLAFKWRDMDPIRRIAVGLIVFWTCFNLYLLVGNEFASLNVFVLPLSWIYAIYRPILGWATASTIVGLAFLL